MRGSRPPGGDQLIQYRVEVFRVKFCDIPPIEKVTSRERASYCAPCAGGGRADMTKILLVDDSKFLRMAIERALARAGYEVLTAVDGPGALDLARKERPDVILLDMLLPKMTGPDVLKALKKDPATTKIAVVAFTGLSQKNAARLQEDGACAFLEKSELGLESGCEKLLGALRDIVQELGLKVPPRKVTAKVGA